jgi:hypothetical protein
MSVCRSFDGHAPLKAFASYIVASCIHLKAAVFIPAHTEDPALDIVAFDGIENFNPIKENACADMFGIVSRVVSHASSSREPG